MATVVNTQKKKGLSLSSTPRRNQSAPHADKSTGSVSGNQSFHTQRINTQTPKVTFNYLNPVSSSAKLQQVIRYEQRNHNRNYSLPKHQWIAQPQPFIQTIRQHLCQKPETAAPQLQRTPNKPELTNEAEEKYKAMEKLFKMQLQQKQKLIQQLQQNNKLQATRIEFLHSELKNVEEKLTSKDQQIKRIKGQHTRLIEEEAKEKEKLKTMVIDSQRVQLSGGGLSHRNKQNKGERKRLDVGKMNEIQQKLNRLISDIGK